MALNHTESRLSLSGPAVAAGSPQELSPELVRKVTDRVYALLLRDLALTRERLGWMLTAARRGEE